MSLPHRGIIWFNVPQSLKHLLERGLVYSIRNKPKPEGLYTLASKYFSPKITGYRVMVRFVKKIDDPQDLQPYLTDSGFQDPIEWWYRANWFKYLHKVTLIDRVPPEIIREALRRAFEI